MHSYAELFSYFGDIEYLDRVEEAAFNRLPAPFLNGSMWAMQYFHQTNTVGGCNDYGLPFECCVTNGNQGWPKFTAHLYAFTPDGGLAAVLFAPSAVDTMLHSEGRTNKVRIVLQTSYPFAEELVFNVSAQFSFPFRVRIPSWAHQATVAADGEDPSPALAGSFKLLHIPAGNCLVHLVLPMPVRIHLEPAGGVSVHAGPLLFAVDLAPEEEKSTDCYYPPQGCYYNRISGTINWRRALVLNKSDPIGGGLRLEHRPHHTGPPFARTSVPVIIRAPTVVLQPSEWAMVNCTSMENGCRECIGPVPSISATDVRARSKETVSFIPFGATDIRMAVLPASWGSAEDVELVV